jgi:energy-coupling factor transporter transmembrane protein EcfT
MNTATNQGFGFFRVFILSTTCLLASILLDHWLWLGSYALFYSIIFTGLPPKIKPIVSIFRWTALFTVPLMLIHTIINPMFDVSYYTFDFLPIRTSGFYYALAISMKVAIITEIAVTIQHGDPERLFREAQVLRLPNFILVVLAATISTIRILKMRIEKVNTAQQARGINTGPKLFYRMKALPKMVIPVISSTLAESLYRSVIMHNRGLLSTKMHGEKTQPFFSNLDVIISTQVILALMLCIYLSGVQ